VREARKKVKGEAVEACKTLLTPLIDLLLKLEVSAGDFTALSKAVYVHRAAEQVRAATGRASISRVAIVTGLTRAEVTKLFRQPIQGAETRNYERHRAQRVIRGWRSDPQFLRENGRPRDLPMHNRTGSFAALVKRYSGDIPPRAMFDQLTASRAITIRVDGTIRLSGQSTPGSGLSLGRIASLGEHAGELVATLTHNLKPTAAARFVGTASGYESDEKLRGVLRDRLARGGRHFLASMEDLLSNPPQRQRQATAKTRRVKLGVTVFVHETEALPTIRRKGQTFRKV